MIIFTLLLYAVIGFGGVISRDVVREKADFFVEENDIRKILTFDLI